VIVIESEEPYVMIFFWRKMFGMQTMRVPVGRVPQIKHTCEGRKIPFIKNACNNFDEKKIETDTKGLKLSLTEYKKLTIVEYITKINDKMNAATFKTTENGYMTDKMTS
jgi:hypothetical protein